ncbi:unnamed protein product [Cuscuta campestris]|uniref:Uncharacterized protein n=1 Tax=Cuscuta campestris TaxID=132261 RepID=A0A484LS50_9ASTE|nr:unnamed protein product [Cuscuta campestris]
MEDNVTHDGDMFKLTANNYSHWKPMMEDHLYCKDLHEPIIYKDKVEGKSDAQWELLNRKAVAMIRKYIDKTLFEHVSMYTNAYELWTKLESMIQKKTPRNKANLVRCSLPESWDTLVVTLSNSAPEGKLTMNTVSDSLLGEEARRMERGDPTYSEANVIENQSRHETRRRSKSRDPHQSQGRSKPRSKITCYYYGKIGHKKTECRSLKRDQKASNIKPDQISPTKKQEEKSTTAVVSREDLLYFVGEGKWKLTKGSLIMARGKKEGSLYVMQAKLFKGEINITYDDMEVWHKRLGHISEKGFHMLARKDLLPDVKGATPKEVWTGKRASYKQLKVFGCRAFVHIPKDERAKLDAKTKECIYLRSPKDEYGYQLWDPFNIKVVRSRDVVFFEDQTIEDIKNSERSRLRSSKSSDLTPARSEDNDTQEANDAEDREPELEQSNQESRDEQEHEEP